MIDQDNNDIKQAYQGIVDKDDIGDLTGYVEACASPKSTAALNEIVRIVYAYSAGAISDIYAESVFYSAAYPGLEGSNLAGSCYWNFYKRSGSLSGFDQCEVEP